MFHFDGDRFRDAGRILLGLAVCAVAGGFSGNPVLADDVSKDSGWTGAFALYGWAAGLDGDVGAFGAPKSEINLGFNEVLENLEFTAMGAGELRRGKFGVFLDVSYARLNSGAQATSGVLSDSVRIEAETAFATPLLQYRTLETEHLQLDAMAGIRIWHASTELGFSGSVLDGRTFKDDATWVDPVLGVKARYKLDDKWTLTGWGMLGGVGAGSDLMWDLFGGVNYSFNENVSAVAGYRAVGVDYESNGYIYDTVQSGLLLGAVFRF